MPLISSPIETERLIMRQLRMSDEDDLFAYQSNPEVVRYLPWPARTREQVREALAKVLSNPDFESEGDGLVLAVERKSDHRVIGQMSLIYRSAEHRRGEFGYAFNPDSAGFGYATEASSALLDFGFGAAGFHRIYADTDARNAKSISLLERLGMRREADLIENEMFKGEWSSSVIYALLDYEWWDRQPS